MEGNILEFEYVGMGNGGKYPLRIRDGGRIFLRSLLLRIFPRKRKRLLSLWKICRTLLKILRIGLFGIFRLLTG